LAFNAFKRRGEEAFCLLAGLTPDFAATKGGRFVLGAVGPQISMCCAARATIPMRAEADRFFVSFRAGLVNFRNVHLMIIRN
jgi:hypothetical protein